ncbi:MAG: methylated-DNA--[protein]-cysteine S-methyltransferase [Armatimonadota bacterium]|nr:methylated-DNA--[protein]-cysteine S-methyltransferase [Armatimonadota bacterium]
MGNIDEIADESMYDCWQAFEVAWGWCAVRRSARGLLVTTLPADDRPAVVAQVRAGAVEQPDDAILRRAASLLTEYFAGRPVSFDLPLDLRGMGRFSVRVLEACAEVPWGETRTYREVAAAAGSPRAARAVGQALGRNPLPIVVPCHRVIGARGDLVGFGAGLEIKRRLLRLEGICAAGLERVR